jgi:phosphohistidine phosphatase SixA
LVTSILFCIAITRVYAPGDFEMLAIRAYTSPALRAMQTLAIIRTEATVVNVSNAINESYMGWRDLAREMKMLKDYFPLFIVVTHQPVVALLACVLCFARWVQASNCLEGRICLQLQVGCVIYNNVFS